MCLTEKKRRNVDISFADLKSVFSTLPGNNVLLQPDAPRFTIVSASGGYLQVTGRSQEELVGRGLFEAFPGSPDDPQGVGEKSVLASLEYVLLHREEHFVPLQRYDIPGPDGAFRERYWRGSNKPVFNNAGKVIYLIHAVEDVTAEVVAQRQRAQRLSTEDAYRLFMQAPMLVGVLRGPQHRIELANEGLLRLWGRGPEVLGQPLDEALPEISGQGFREILDEVLRNGRPYQAYQSPALLKQDGIERVLYFDFTYQPFFDSGAERPTGVFAVAHEVTAQVEARKRLEDINRELGFVMDVMPQLVWHTQPDGYADFFNRNYLDYSGKALHELEGSGWVGLVHADDRAATAAVWNKALAGAESYMVEHRLLGKDGVYRWFLTRGVPLRGQEGKILKWYGTSTDIDSQKQYEVHLEQNVRERTRDLEIRNRELEQFTYVSHHDLQEPLRKIVIFLDMIRADAGNQLSAASQKRMDRVVEAARRMSAALRDVLNFASLSKMDHLEPVDLSVVLDAVQADLELLIAEKGAGVQVGKLPLVQALPQQMHQLFYNLLNNALKFTKPGVPPLIRVHCSRAGAEEIRRHPGLLQGQAYYCISVQDNGIGFPSELSEKIFGMFQRLHSKDAYAGTGIGLALCKKVVENHGGSIRAESRSGHGTIFFVLLPVEGRPQLGGLIAEEAFTPHG